MYVQKKVSPLICVPVWVNGFVECKSSSEGFTVVIWRRDLIVVKPLWQWPSWECAMDRIDRNDNRLLSIRSKRRLMSDWHKYEDQSRDKKHPFDAIIPSSEYHRIKTDQYGYTFEWFLYKFSSMLNIYKSMYLVSGKNNELYEMWMQNTDEASSIRIHIILYIVTIEIRVIGTQKTKTCFRTKLCFFIVNSTGWFRVTYLKNMFFFIVEIGCIQTKWCHYVRIWYCRCVFSRDRKNGMK